MLLTLYHPRILKMQSLRKLFLVLLLCASYGFSQEGNTVFITKEIKDEKKERKSFFGEAGAFSNFSISVPFRANTLRGVNDPDTGEKTSESWFLPDGINFHGGFGVHSTETFALSINTGIDGMITPKLVAVPVYASLLINPRFSEDSTLALQYGIGRAFALGRGDLSGLYQKYRLGFTTGDKMGFFIEANYYGFGLRDIRQVSTINLGICLFNFE